MRSGALAHILGQWRDLTNVRGWGFPSPPPPSLGRTAQIRVDVPAWDTPSEHMGATAMRHQPWTLPCFSPRGPSRRHRLRSRRLASFQPRSASSAPRKPPPTTESQRSVTAKVYRKEELPVAAESALELVDDPPAPGDGRHALAAHAVAAEEDQHLAPTGEPRKLRDVGEVGDRRAERVVEEGGLEPQEQPATVGRPRSRLPR